MSLPSSSSNDCGCEEPTAQIAKEVVMNFLANNHLLHIRTARCAVIKVGVLLTLKSVMRRTNHAE